MCIASRLEGGGGVDEDLEGVFRWKLIDQVKCQDEGEAAGK